MKLLKEKPLATLSAIALVLCVVPVLSLLVQDPATGVLSGLAVTAWVGLPAIYNLFRGLGTSSIAKSWRAALILSIPSALSVALIYFVRFGTTDPQAPLALLFWPLGFLILLPIAWAFARGYHENHEPRAVA